ncbi:MAG TPA: hypothetical protein VK745_29930 [Polyangiaceae bacterium]|nr:hypothetical protein [Polyangiaceae bacterium]
MSGADCAPAPAFADGEKYEPAIGSEHAINPNATQQSAALSPAMPEGRSERS